MPSFFFLCPLMGLTCLLYHHSCLGAYEDCLGRASCFHLWTESCCSHPQSSWCPQSFWWTSHTDSSQLCLFCKSMCSLIGMDNWIDCPWGQRVWLLCWCLLSAEEIPVAGEWAWLRTENSSQKNWWSGPFITGDSVWHKSLFFFPAVRFLDAFRGCSLRLFQLLLGFSLV